MRAYNAVVAIYRSHIDAEDAVKTLHKDGFDLKNLIKTTAAAEVAMHYVV